MDGNFTADHVALKKGEDVGLGVGSGMTPVPSEYDEWKQNATVIKTKVCSPAKFRHPDTC
jgi:hypothetical protein